MTELSQYAEPLRHWASGLGIAIAITLFVALLKPIVIRRLDVLAARTQTHVDNAIVDALRGTKLVLVAFVALTIGAQMLEPSAAIQKLLKTAATLSVFGQLGFWVAGLWSSWLRHSRMRALETNAAAATSLSAVGFVGELLLWTAIVLLALDNLGVNVTALIAGLGVGGIAVALALQNVLGDLFASLSIVIDKPFVIGDFIVVDDYMGTVENVGLKTTRIRSLGGEQIVFANSDLLKNRVRNYKRMFERRVLFGLGVLYQTPSETLEAIPDMIRSIVESQQKVRFERAHCAKFGDSSIDFEVVYWVLDADYNLYMNIQQAINFRIKRTFAEHGIEFAFPTRTVVVDGPLRLERSKTQPAQAQFARTAGQG